MAFAVHQCARFTHDPKASHEEAVLRMCRHLQGTKTDGSILKPNPELGIDMFVDADFAGLCRHEDNCDPISARSRTGIIIALAGCPIDWASKPQTMTATSTMESEMIALSHGMRRLIPVKRTVNELLTCLGASSSASHTTRMRVHEDNNGCIIMTHGRRMNPQTRHHSTELWWFREKLEEHSIRLERTDSDKQLADVTTKSLLEVTFVKLRKKLCGW